MVIVIDGRLYGLEIEPNNCESLIHGHDEPHEDGSPGLPFHHHHSTRCGDNPRQATLRPLEFFADRDADIRNYEAAHPGGTELARRSKAQARAENAQPLPSDTAGTIYHKRRD